MPPSPLPPPLLSYDNDHNSISGGSGLRPRKRRRRRNNTPFHSIQSTLDNIVTQLTNKLSSQCNAQLPLLLPPPHILLPSVLSGTLAFYATSFSSQYIQYKLLKLSTGTRPHIIPISVGVVTVAVGSWMGHLAGLGTVAAAVRYTKDASLSSSRRMQWGRMKQPPSDFIERCNTLLEETLVPMKDSACRTIHEMTRPMTINTNNTNNNRRMQHERKEAWFHAARICIIGLLTYKTLFRSNFIALSPSSYTARGSFATKGIPTSFNYATKSQREVLHKLGSRYGCHTCGSRLFFHRRLPNFITSTDKKKMIFHGDHIPPVSVAKQINNRWYNRHLGRIVTQKFYPQCTNCSNKQGGLLSRAVNAGHGNLHAVGGGSESCFHGWRVRVGHLTGGLVACISTLGIDGTATTAAEEENDDEVRWALGSSSSSEQQEAVVMVRSSTDRIRSIQYWFEDLVYDAKRTMRNVWSGK